MTAEDRLNLAAIAAIMRRLPGVCEESVQVVTHYLGMCVERMGEDS